MARPAEDRYSSKPTTYQTAKEKARAEKEKKMEEDITRAVKAERKKKAEEQKKAFQDTITQMGREMKQQNRKSVSKPDTSKAQPGKRANEKKTLDETLNRPRWLSELSSQFKPAGAITSVQKNANEQKKPYQGMTEQMEREMQREEQRNAMSAASGGGITEQEERDLERRRKAAYHTQPKQKTAQEEAVQANKDFNQYFVAGKSNAQKKTPEEEHRDWQVFLSSNSPEQLEILKSEEQKKLDNLQSKFLEAVEMATYIPSSEEFKAELERARAALESQQQRITEIKNAKYFGEQSDKKAGLEQSAAAASDYDDLVAQGKNVSGKAGLFEDGKINIISFLNSKELRDYADFAAPVLMDDSLGLNVAIGTDPKYRYINDEEADRLRYYYQKGDGKSFDEYLSLLDRDLNERQYTGDKEKREKAMDKLGIFGKIATGAGSIAEGLKTPLAFLESGYMSLKEGITGEYTAPDAYSPMQKPVALKKDLRDYTLKDADPYWKAVGEVAFGIADAAVKLPFGPVGAAIYSAAELAGESANNVIKNGGTYDQAARVGTVNGVVSFVADRLPVAKILNIPKAGVNSAKMGNEIVKVLKDAGIQGTKELVAEYTKTLTDNSVMGVNSEYERYVKELTETGIDEKDAREQAGMQFFIFRPFAQAAKSAATGAPLSGIKQINSIMKNAKTPYKTRPKSYPLPTVPSKSPLTVKKYNIPKASR